MNVKISKVCLTIILFIASLIPIIDATFITIYPLDTEDDAFVTGIGLYFGDTPFLPLRDSANNIVIGTRFRNVAIPQGSKINNATLRVKSSYGYPSASGITVTITGDDADDSRSFNDSGSFSRTYTLAFVVWDISDVNGNTWAEVDVTEIIQEIIDRVGWSSGNSLSLVYFTDQGTPRREFASLDTGGGGYKARIDVFYGVEPPEEEVEEISDEADTPFNETEIYVWEYVETYRGIDIYNVTQYGDPEFQCYGLDTAFNSWYFNVTKGPGSEIEWDTGAFSTSQSGALDPILGLDPWTLIFADKGTAQVYVSNDEFVSSVGTDPNDQYNLNPWSGNIGSMAIDPDGETIHLVWGSPTPAFPGNYNIIYTNFTLNRDNGAITWAPSYTNVSAVAWTQKEPVIYVQPNGTLHVIWEGEQGTATSQIWYRRRAANGTWFDQVRISDSDVGGNPHSGADVLANDETGDALIVWTYDAASVYWEMVFPNNTVSPADRTVSSGLNPSMVNDRENNIANIVYQTTGGNPIIRFRNMTIANGSSWSASINLSPAGEKHLYPDIGMNPTNRSISVVWYNDWNLWVAANWWNAGQTPVAKKTKVTNERLQWNYIEEVTDAVILDTFIFLVYPNGTLVDTGPLDEGEDPEDTIDDLLGGAQPEDPQEEEYKVIGKFQWKLLVLAVGLIMLLGSPIAGVYYGGDTATWIRILFIMFFGIGILWQIKSM